MKIKTDPELTNVSSGYNFIFFDYQDAMHIAERNGLRISLTPLENFKLLITNDPLLHIRQTARSRARPRLKPGCGTKKKQAPLVLCRPPNAQSLAQH